MGRPYIQNLRKRMVEDAATTSRHQAAARFGDGMAALFRWMATLMTTVTVMARSSIHTRRSGAA